MATKKRKSPSGGLVTRKSMNFRIPFDLLDKVDLLRQAHHRGPGSPELGRTDVVVRAIADWCHAAEASARRGLKVRGLDPGAMARRRPFTPGPGGGR